MKESLDTLINRSTNINEKYLSISEFNHVYHRAELLLSYNLIRWLAQYFQVDLVDPSTSLHEKMSTLCNDQQDLITYCTKVVQTVTDTSATVEIEIDFANESRDPYGEWLQNTLQFEERKTLASNYTENAEKVFEKISLPHPVNSIVDHFCGSGNLILAYLSSYVCESESLGKGLHVRINDLMPTVVLLAYCRIIALGLNVEITASIQDGFTVEGKFDCILINPPYTRSHRISPSTKEHIASLKSRVAQYTTGQAGLHFWAVIGLHQLQSHNGVALVVLPRAILNAKYSQALKDIILDEYTQIDLFEYTDIKAFSQGSDLKELILKLNKNGLPSVNFHQINHHNFKVNTLATIAPEEIQNEWNWGIYFLQPQAVELGRKIQRDLDLKPRQDVGMEITRGIEMYGPDVFFFPNRNWNLSTHDNQVTISDEQNSYSFPESYVETILRKPNLYKTTIEPKIDHVVLTIDENKLQKDLPDELQQYLTNIKLEAKSARNRFGQNWFRHPSIQLAQKNPRGHIFIIDKLDLESTPTLAYFTETKVACTKNFYLIRLNTEVFTQIEILAAWLNSTIYLLLYLLHRREIGGTYGRMQIIDYDYHRLFPDLSKLSHGDLAVQMVLIEFRKIKSMDRGMLPDQLFDSNQMKLDQALADLFGLDIDISKIHERSNELLKSRQS